MNSYITLLIDLIDWLKLKFYSLTHVTLALMLMSVVFNSLLLGYYSGVDTITKTSEVFFLSKADSQILVYYEKSISKAL